MRSDSRPWGAASSLQSQPARGPGPVLAVSARRPGEAEKDAATLPVQEGQSPQAGKHDGRAQDGNPVRAM